MYQDIEDKGIRKVICLGDIIGYGPDPVACIDVARNFDVNLRGNHEEAVINGAFGFNPIAKEAIDWTRNQLKPSWHSLAPKRARWEILKDLPLTYREGNILYVHGSPRDPTMEYILKSDTEDLFGEIPIKIREIFSMIPWVCFVGHTHTPGIITEESRFYPPVELNGSFDLEEGHKYIINVGSVGQLRDHRRVAGQLPEARVRLRQDRGQDPFDLPAGRPQRGPPPVRYLTRATDRIPPGRARNTRFEFNVRAANDGEGDWPPVPL